MSDTADLIIGDLAGFARDPLGFVMWGFAWGEPGSELETKSGPEEWQRDLLIRVRDGLSPHSAICEAVASGHGVGKSALVSWLILWAISTFEDTKGIVTANTDNQLKTKTWPELMKWYRLFIGRDLFKIEATCLFSVDPDHEKTWRIDRIPWSEHRSEGFAGLHNQGRRAIVIYDEASAISDTIWETTEGFLSDEDTERLWFTFGNPTRSTGRFRECFGAGAQSAVWHTTQVDSRTVSFTNKEQIARWISAYGEDSDFVRVRVKGEFPRVGASEFISLDLVAEARQRNAEAQRFDPLIIGVDVARFGDDESVICFRKGRDARTYEALRLRGLDTMQLAARVLEEATRLRADAVFIDEGGVGGGVVDRCRQLRLHVLGVQFGGKPDRANFDADDFRYANKRAEMWGWLREWLKVGAIEDSDDLQNQLIGPQYGYNPRDEIQLERKADMKARGMASPDWADALALTFAFPVFPSAQAGGDFPAPEGLVHEYDPFELAGAA